MQQNRGNNRNFAERLNNKSGSYNYIKNNAQGEEAIMMR